MTLEEYKAYRIAQSKAELEEYLETHPITSTAHGGVEGVYSITSEKQNELLRNYFSYETDVKMGKNPILTWNETGKSCVEWKPEEYLLLCSQIRERATSLASYQRKLEEEINIMNDKAEIAALVFDYDSVPYENNDFFASNDSTPTDNSTDIPTDIEEPNNEPSIEESAEITE